MPTTYDKSCRFSVLFHVASPLAGLPFSLHDLQLGGLALSFFNYVTIIISIVRPPECCVISIVCAPECCVNCWAPNIDIDCVYYSQSHIYNMLRRASVLGEKFKKSVCRDVTTSRKRKCSFDDDINLQH